MSGNVLSSTPNGIPARSPGGVWGDETSPDLISQFVFLFFLVNGATDPSIFDEILTRSPGPYTWGCVCLGGLYDDGPVTKYLPPSQTRTFWYPPGGDRLEEYIADVDLGPDQPGNSRRLISDNGGVFPVADVVEFGISLLGNSGRLSIYAPSITFPDNPTEEAWNAGIFESVIEIRRVAEAIGYPLGLPAGDILSGSQAVEGHPMPISVDSFSHSVKNTMIRNGLWP